MDIDTASTAPIIKEVAAIASITNDSTPDYIFSSTVAGTITYGGSCSSSTTTAVAGNNTITINTTVAGAVAPSVGNFILFVNNSIAESYGLRGYYMEFKLSCDSTKAVELFSVGSSVMKSYP